jgi:outer membrane protein TolC
MKRGSFLLFSFLSLSAACAPVGPNYQRNDPSMPSRFGSLEKGVTSPEAAGKDRLGSWWEVLKDPALDALMERALHGHQDIRIARARVMQARALSLTSSSRQYPEGGFTGTYERFRRTESGSQESVSAGSSSGTALGGSNRQNNLFLIGFDASWEIDLFGGVRRGMEAAEADLSASEDTLRDTLVTLQGEVARNYIEYRGLQLRLDIARQEVKIRLENVQITEARSRAGFVSELDLARARGELARAESRIPTFEKLLGSSLHRLGVLLGQEPLNLAVELRSPMPLPRFSGDDLVKVDEVTAASLGPETADRALAGT